MVHVSTRVLPDPSVGGAVLGDDTAIHIRGLLVWTQQRRASAKITGAVQLFKGMADRGGRGARAVRRRRGLAYRRGDERRMLLRPVECRVCSGAASTLDEGNMI